MLTSSTLSYREKNKLLMLASLVLAVVAWFFALEKTFALWNGYRELTQRLALAGVSPATVLQYRQKLAVLDTRIGDSKGYSQEKLLDLICTHCQANGIILKEFPRSSVTAYNGYALETMHFIVEGGFVKLVTLLFHLEKISRAGRLVSVEFRTKSNLKTQKLSLTATIWLQHIKKK